MRFEDAYEDFKIYASKRHKKQGFETLSRNFNLHILPYFKGKFLNELNKNDIILWQDYIIEFNYSNNFNSILYYEFSSFIKYCINCNYIEENIVLKVGKFKKKYEEKKYDIYSLKEFKIFLRHFDNFVYQQYFNFMFYCGTRPSEALALKFSDINGNYIHITKSLHRRGNREVDSPKNNSSIRYIYLPFKIRFNLFKLKKYYISIYGVYNKDYYLFGEKKPLSTTTIDRYKDKACKSANLRTITQHQFRHSYASYKIHKGVAIDYVSKSMGHSRVSTTLDIYLHNEKKTHNVLFQKFNIF